jgi:hypothetical protein
MLSKTVTSGSVYPTLCCLLLMLTLLYVHLFAFSLFDIQAGGRDIFTAVSSLPSSLPQYNSSFQNNPAILRLCILIFSAASLNTSQ